MRFAAVRDLRLRSGEVWCALEKESDLIIASNGKPVDVLSGIESDRLEEHFRALRRAHATLAVTEIQKRSRREGLDKISEAEIEAEIQAVRRTRPRGQ